MSENEILERLILWTIGLGNKDLKSIGLALGVPKKTIQKILLSCEAQKLVETSRDGFSLTSLGLFNATQCLGVEEGYTCESDSGKPYFGYHNHSNKDVIFFPHLPFDQTENGIDDYKYKLYETEIKKKTSGGVEILKAIENCMSAGLSSWEGGFWNLKSEKNYLYGFRTTSLEKALQDTGDLKIEVKLAFSENSYLAILTTKMQSGVINEISLKFYLSNSGETPYIDTLNRLETRLQVFLNFIGEKGIPKGRTVIIERLQFKKSDSNIAKDSFIPKIMGKYFFEGTPLIIVIPADEFKEISHLGKISPWFVTCNGGFIIKEFEEKRRFRLSRVENYVLDEAILFSLALDPSQKNDVSD